MTGPTTINSSCPELAVYRYYGQKEEGIEGCARGGGQTCEYYDSREEILSRKPVSANMCHKESANIFSHDGKETSQRAAASG